MKVDAHDPAGDRRPEVPEAEPKRGWRRALGSPHAWVTTTYFAEGFPYALVNSVADVLFLGMGAKVQAIGLTALFHLPWNLKFLWAPVLDRYETKRRFLIGCEALLLALTLVLALLGTASSLAMFALVFVLMAIVAVTHDMAIDGYYMEALDQQGQSTFVGYRAAAYRGAVLLASGPLLIIEGWLGWRAAWLSAAAVLLALLIYHVVWLPRAELPRAPLRTWLAPARRRRLLAVVLGLAVLL
ncbi:MAG: hypothetical protein IAG13_34100, partial [Deltaproteobacteria bacterium]|nr:hypothetical protein [Nannocystaceae bacterium]